MIVVATGSEVLALRRSSPQPPAAVVRVVSMPCTSVFDRQDAAKYKSPASCRRIRASRCRRAASPMAGGMSAPGKVIGIDRFGESAPAGELFKLFGFTAANVVGDRRVAGCTNSDFVPVSPGRPPRPCIVNCNTL